jgi:hypothetical protein
VSSARSALNPVGISNVRCSMKRLAPLLAAALLLSMAFPTAAAGTAQQLPQPTNAEIDLIHVGSNAAETAEILNTLYNGARTGPEARVVVFVVPSTSYLFVRASEADLLNIRRLLRPL